MFCNLIFLSSGYTASIPILVGIFSVDVIFVVPIILQTTQPIYVKSSTSCIRWFLIMNVTCDVLQLVFAIVLMPHNHSTDSCIYMMNTQGLPIGVVEQEMTIGWSLVMTALRWYCLRYLNITNMFVIIETISQLYHIKVEHSASIFVQ